MRAIARPESAHPIRRRRNFAIACLILLACIATGCTKWSHPAKGEREYNTDSTICWQAADESGVTNYWPKYHVYKACMVDRGWNAG
jgi:hypothetical protein